MLLLLLLLSAYLNKILLLSKKTSQPGRSEIIVQRRQATIAHTQCATCNMLAEATDHTQTCLQLAAADLSPIWTLNPYPAPLHLSPCYALQLRSVTLQAGGLQVARSVAATAGGSATRRYGEEGSKGGRDIMQQF